MRCGKAAEASMRARMLGAKDGISGGFHNLNLQGRRTVCLSGGTCHATVSQDPYSGKVGRRDVRVTHFDVMALLPVQRVLGCDEDLVAH